MVIRGGGIQIAAVAFSQFVVSLSALGLPTFFPFLLKEENLTHSHLLWSGILYGIPNLFTALSSPFWGKASDLFGKKVLLVRAQLGLALSFLLTSYASTLHGFLFALVLQGLLGGTYSASRAYLSSHVQGEKLAKALNVMEAAPKLAIVLSPILVGTLLEESLSLKSYRYLAILPLMAALICCLLPTHSHSENLTLQQTHKLKATHSYSHQNESILLENTNWRTDFFDLRSLMILQLGFGFAATLASPYLTLIMRNQFPTLEFTFVGVLFALPNLVYLFFASPFHELIKNFPARLIFSMALFLQSLCWLALIQSNSILLTIIIRLIQGISLTVCLISLNRIIAESTPQAAPGRFLGWLDSSQRLSVVLAGLISSLYTSYFNPSSLLLLSSGLFLALALCLFIKSKEVLHTYG